MKLVYMSIAAVLILFFNNCSQSSILSGSSNQASLSPTEALSPTATVTPMPNPTPVPVSFTACAAEFKFCDFEGIRLIKYGRANFTFGIYENGVQCENDFFVDPEFGVAKNCATSNSTLTYCAANGDFCAFTGTRTVYFGTQSQITAKVVTGGVLCQAGAFPDPAPSAQKYCWY